MKLPSIPAVFIAMAAVYFLNRIFAWVYRVWPSFDIPMHILGGFLAGLLGLACWAWVRDRYGVRGMPAWAVGVFAVCFAALIATLWEFHEFLMDALYKSRGWARPWMQPSLQDTMGDLLMGLLGAGVAALIFREKKTR